MTRKRAGISQSMDLFIIIAAVLAVGGVVTASIYNLAGAASSNAAIQVVQGMAAGGSSSPSTVVKALTLTVKNSGSTTISGQMTVTLGGTVQPATALTSPVPTIGCSASATCSAAATVAGSTGNPVLLGVPSLTLPAGTQVTINEGTISGLTTGWSTGTQYTVTIQFGSAQASITLTA